MKKLLTSAVLATGLLLGAITPSYANRTGDVVGGLIVGGLVGAAISSSNARGGYVYEQPEPVYARPAAPVVYEQPAPIYAQPAPVYAQPAPVYAQPAPVYVQQAPVYVQQAPVYVQRRPVYVQPGPRIYIGPGAVSYRYAPYYRGYGHHGRYYN